MSVTKKQLKDGQKALRILKNLLTSKEAIKSLESLEEDLNQQPVSKEEATNPFALSEDLKDNFDYIGFSDGACRGNPGPGAWGALVQSPDENILFEGSGVEVNTTNNKMELQGAIEAIRFIKNHECYETALSAVLVSDSKYVVDGMNQWVPGWKKRGWKKADKKVPENVELWQELDHLREGMGTVAFQWVKGHAGHPQNEFCDQLANNALDDAGF
jgi:ribonuclease HI